LPDWQVAFNKNIVIKKFEAKQQYNKMTLTTIPNDLKHEELPA